jgi:hypothetical protein
VAKPFETWTVGRHGPVEKLADNLWRVEGDIPGAPLRRVMSVAKLADGRLAVFSAIALDDAEMKELEAWGTPAFLIVPNAGHRLDAKIWKARYPTMRVVCPEGAKAKVAEVVPVDATEADLGEGVSYGVVDGTAGRDAYLLVKSASGTTLVLNDVVMNMKKLPGFGGFMMGLFGFTSPAPKVTGPAKRFLVADQAAVKAHLEKLAETPKLSRIVVSHGAAVTASPADALRAAAAALA